MGWSVCTSEGEPQPSHSSVSTATRKQLQSRVCARALLQPPLAARRRRHRRTHSFGMHSCAISRCVDGCISGHNGTSGSESLSRDMLVALPVLDALLLPWLRGMYSEPLSDFDTGAAATDMDDD
eukprot:358162-Chlamydomonas_euryale.AAC.3